VSIGVALGLLAERLCVERLAVVEGGAGAAARVGAHERKEQICEPVWQHVEAQSSSVRRRCDRCLLSSSTGLLAPAAQNRSMIVSQPAVSRRL
jgi:hypothetical protein